MGTAALIQRTPFAQRSERSFETWFHLPHKSPWQNLAHALRAIPLEKLLVQAHSSQLPKQQSSEWDGFWRNSYWG